MPTPETAFTATIAELAAQSGIPPAQVIVKEAGQKVALARILPGCKGSTVFAVTPENDPLLRGTFINAGWKHRGTQDGDVFWRAF